VNGSSSKSSSFNEANQSPDPYSFPTYTKQRRCFSHLVSDESVGMLKRESASLRSRACFLIKKVAAASCCDRRAAR